MTRHDAVPVQSLRHTLRSAGGWFGPLLAAFGVGCLLAALDLFGAEFWANHPMAAQAIGGVILFIQGGLLLPKFLNFRDERRQERVSQLAYAALAQAANDAGRKLLAPLNGASMFALGIEAVDREPGASLPTAVSDARRLRELGYEVKFTETRGVWSAQRPLVEERLPRLLADPAFVADFFRRVSRVRRDLQAAAGEWAPTMFSDATRTDDLNQFRELVLDCQDLQVALRDGPKAVLDADGRIVDRAFIDRVTAAFWTFDDRYQHIRNHLNKKGVHERSESEHDLMLRAASA